MATFSDVNGDPNNGVCLSPNNKVKKRFIAISTHTHTQISSKYIIYPDVKIYLAFPDPFYSSL